MPLTFAPAGMFSEKTRGGRIPPPRIDTMPFRSYQVGCSVFDSVSYPSLADSMRFSLLPRWAALLLALAAARAPVLIAQAQTPDDTRMWCSA